MSKALVLGAAALALSVGAASAQVGYPGYDYGGATVPLYGYAAPGYGYAATAPLYNYAAPAYAAPATAGTTIIIVTPGQASQRQWWGPGIITTHPAIGAVATGVPAIGAGARESRQTRLRTAPRLGIIEACLRHPRRHGLPAQEATADHCVC